MLAKCLLNSFDFFLLSVTNASSVLSGCRLCFGVSPFKLCRSLHALRPSFLRSKSLHVLFHLSCSLALFRQQLHLCCYLVVVCPIALSRVSFNFLSGLVALCYHFGYLFCPAWFVFMYVTPRDGLLGSVFDGITDFAVVLVRVFPELQALQVFF